MAAGWLFLAAYTSSGLAGLVYEVAWTRLLTLFLGHTTAAVSTVLAAFMGGLAIGSAAGGRVASRMMRRQALQMYAALELVVIVSAIAIPFALDGARPLLRWAYQDGTAGWLFPSIRLACSLAALAVPAAALGATFPMAVRWFVRDPDHPGRDAGLLYAVNTVGAALGAVAAGFVLIPSVGLSGTTAIGVAASAVSVAVALLLARKASDEGPFAVAESSSGDGVSSAGAGRTSPASACTDSERATARVAEAPAARIRQVRRSRNGEPKSRRVPGPKRPGLQTVREAEPPREDFALAAAVVAATGFATFTYEVAWTRVFSMVIGPSTYAFAATLTAFIGGIAVGSFVGSALAGRSRRPHVPLAVALGAAAMAAGWASSSAGGSLPRRLMQELAARSEGAGDLLFRHSLDAAVLVVPLAIALGVAFPLALELAGSRYSPPPRRLGAVYAVNTVAAVAGSLFAGFVAIPLAGLQNTIRGTSALLAAAAVLVVVRAIRSRAGRIAGLLPATAALGLVLTMPAWDRDLLASGMYMYARNRPRDLDLASMLKAGTLLYYAEGATGSVSVKRLTGELSLAIDGKVDASSSGDMLTQKLLGELPLLLHADPSEVCIIGLGSGVTLASALVHPVHAVDVVEISPEVVEASRLFGEVNRNALDDGRVRLIVGDGRTHLALASRRYDVIISEPSNPWMAGVAALFTREFFETAHSRLKPGGIICQWMHTYDITDADLRSIAATFQSVFQNGTMWLIGRSDLLLVASTDDPPPLERISENWQRAGVAADLKSVSLGSPFGLLSLYVGGPAEMIRYAAGAAIQHDDRMALEFSGPLAVNTADAGENVAALRGLLGEGERPPAVERAFAAAGATEWHERAAMLLKVQVYVGAYDDEARALSLDPANAEIHAGLIRAAVGARREADAERLLRSEIAAHPGAVSIRVALSKLQAATGAFREAVATAEQASEMTPLDPRAIEQLASLHADAGDAAKLAPVAAALQKRFGDRPSARYYAAAVLFQRGEFDAALTLARQAVEADGSNPAAHNLLGAIYASMGQRPPARESFEAARRLNPADTSTYTNLGLLALDSGDRNTAAELFTEALILDPQSPAAREGLARAQSVR